MCLWYAEPYHLDYSREIDPRNHDWHKVLIVSYMDHEAISVLKQIHFIARCSCFWGGVQQ